MAADGGRVGGRILVVDDNKINRMLLVRGLTAQGHTVATAENGRQALDHLRAQPFDVVLLDILMPEMDGYETLAQITKDASLRRIPVIMITAVDEMDSVIRCIGMGATDYLPKPFNPALLEARINASLATKRLRDLELEYIEQAGLVADAATAVEAGGFDPRSLEGVATRGDALGRLARVFLRMAEEVHLREQRLRRQIERLRIDVAEMRRTEVGTLSVFLPMDQRHAIARGEALPDRARGAALFADVSGSTPLTEALANELGLEQGAEEISRQLNQVFGALIDEVNRYGGSVICFGGDAITCWFDEDDGLRATASALAMQDAMARFATVITPTETVFSLGIKVAVVAGEVRRFLVGDPDRHQIEVLAGRKLDELAAGEHLASRGEVLVGADVVEGSGGAVAVASWRTDAASEQRFAVVAGLSAAVRAAPWADLPVDALTDAQCRPWVVPILYERLRTGKRSYLSELRPAVSLRLQFSGIDYDADGEAGEKLDAYVRWVQSVVARYEGCLIRVSTGDKGSEMHVAFGAPTTHEDDAARGISAAQELHQTPAELAFVTGVQIGVAGGLTWTGAYGGPSRQTYAVQGSVVVLASRLMQAAAGGILCDSAVREGARTTHAFEALPPITLKGIAEPVPVYRPVSERVQSGAPVEPAGREAERALLRDALEAARQGESRVVVIEGEAGTGKSWLLDNLRRQAEGAQVRVLSGKADRGPEAGPFHAWRGVYGRLLDVSSEASAAEYVRRIDGVFRGELDESRLAPLLSAVVPTSPADSEAMVGPGGEENSDIARRALAKMLQRGTSGSPVAVVLDDAHLMDRPSWQLALEVSKQVSPLLLVIAMCPVSGWELGAARELMTAPRATSIQLGPLPSDEMRVVVGRCLGVSTLPEPVLELISEVCEGNPHFCVEFARALLADGYLAVDDDECRVTPGRSLRDASLPATASRVVGSRLDRLSSSEKLTLKVASVVGREFDCEIVEAVYPDEDDRGDLGEVIDALVSHGLVEPRATEHGRRCRFRSSVTHEVVYATLLFAQRRQLHRAVAEWHERTCGDRLSRYYSTLAYHWRRADNPTKAVEYLERAGQQAARDGAYEEAERFFRESLELEAEAGVLSAEFYDTGDEIDSNDVT